MHFVYEAFWELGSERETGMSAGQIPRSAISQFTSEYGMRRDEADAFRALIRSMDTIYLAQQDKKHPTDDKIVDFATVDDSVGVSAILKRLAKPPAVK